MGHLGEASPLNFLLLEIFREVEGALKPWDLAMGGDVDLACGPPSSALLGIFHSATCLDHLLVEGSAYRVPGATKMECM